YPKYEYGKAYKPITSGMVRVFDEKLDAATFLYTQGESRNIVPGRPPIPPGMPGFLGGGSFRAEESVARSRESALAAGRLLTRAESRWVPGIPRAFADPLNGVLAFPEPL